MTHKHRSAIALGLEPARLVLKNATIINVFSHELEVADIAIEDGQILGIGMYEGTTEIDLKGRYVAPGFIDGHVHIESSMLTPSEFSKIVIPRGTTRVIADPHEIANVRGVKGLGFMHKSSQDTPLRVHIMIPSCVPATSFEHTGASIDVEDIYNLHKREGILGLGEVMDYPSAIQAEKSMVAKIDTMKDRVIDGHAPGVHGKELNAYLLHHIKTDHECTTPEELHEKVARGMYIHLRQGSATRNVRDLLQGVTPYHTSRLMFCTDDKHPGDIRKEGHINHNINIAIEEGIDPITAIQMATINTATCYKLDNVGAIAPGFVADLVVFDDLNRIDPDMVFIDGELVAEKGDVLFQTSKFASIHVTDTVKFNRQDIDFTLRLQSDHVKVIQFIKNNVTTNEVHRKVTVVEGIYQNNPSDNLLKIAVVERHNYTGNVGIGLLEGYGLQQGAVAMTIAHDSHNIIVVGDNDDDMMTAILELKRHQGGITIVKQGDVIDTLSLEIGGLMTNQDIDVIENKLTRMHQVAHDMGVDDNIDDPFLSLAFLSLPVIPDLKLTDTGYFDVLRFQPTTIEVE